MAVLTKLTHVTRYVYDKPVLLSPQLVRLRPAPHSRSAVPAYSLKVTPETHFVNWQQDPTATGWPDSSFPSRRRIFGERRPACRDGGLQSFDFFIEDYAETWPFTYAPDLAKDLAPFLECEEEGSCSRPISRRFRVNANRRRISSLR